MSAKKQQNPNIDFGFYATVPRLVRTDYKKVTPIQKWLYTCLKDLCGDDGTCYRTLRVLSEETGISIGLLSESIPVLHTAGLIHAEKKKRATGGKEVWHITIVDIWLANGKTHPSKRSQGEQTISENVHNTNIQDVNIHNVNEVPQECSPHEPECSQILHRSNNSLSKNITEERTNNNDMSLDISNTRTQKNLDNTVLEGGNDQTQQNTPSESPELENIASQQNEQGNAPTENKVPEIEAQPQIEALPPTKEETQPASYSPSETTNKRQRKPRTSKTKALLTDTTPIPPPAKPSEDQLWTPLTCMLLADYYRGSVLEEMQRKGTKYDKAVQAAIKLVNQQHKTYQDVDSVFRYMKCIDKDMPDGLWDEWWDGKDVDLWNVGDHCTGKLAEIERKKKERGTLSRPGQSNTSHQKLAVSMTHDDACKLAQDAIEEAKQYNITITAQAFSSKNNPDIWGVRIKWDDGSKDGFPFPVLKTREQWGTTLTEIRNIIKLEAKQNAMRREAK